MLQDININWRLVTSEAPQGFIRESHGVHDSSLLFLLLRHTEKMAPGSSLRWVAEGRDDRQTETGEDPSGNGENTPTVWINEPPAQAALRDSAVAILGGF